MDEIQSECLVGAEPLEIRERLPAVGDEERPWRIAGRVDLAADDPAQGFDLLMRRPDQERL